MSITSTAVRIVTLSDRPRCPQCHCFVRLDAGTCTACGVAFALGIKPEGSRQPAPPVGLIHAEPAPPALSGGNARAFENLHPNGKIRKSPKKPKDSKQLDLFLIPETSFDFREVL